MTRLIQISLAKPKYDGLYQYLLLMVIILIATILRFHKLGEWSFWGDEMFTVGGREDGFNYTFTRQSLSMTLIQLTVASFGITEWTARVVPAIIGIITIPLLYFPIKKIFDPAVGLAAVLLIAISPWHLYWSQNARFYIALLLFYSLALFAFYIGIEEDRPWYLCLTLIFLGLATKERLLALLFIPVVAAYLILLKILPFEKPAGLRWRNLALFFLPGLIIGLFFVRPYILNIPEWMQGFGYSNNDPFWLLATVVYYLGIPTVCMGTLGAFYLLGQRRRIALLLAVSVGVPLLVIMAISFFHYTANRYVFISLTGWIILAGFAAVELLRQSPKQTKLLAGGVLIFLLLQPLSEDALYYQYQNGNRDNWKGAFQVVKTQQEPNDVVVSINPELADYYLQTETVELTDVDLASIEANGQRVWFVEDMVGQALFPNVHDWFMENAQQIANLDVHAQARTFRMRVYLYDPMRHPGNNQPNALVEGK